jgi:hypothetical protein
MGVSDHPAKYERAVAPLQRRHLLSPIRENLCEYYPAFRRIIGCGPILTMQRAITYSNCIRGRQSWVARAQRVLKLFEGNERQEKKCRDRRE